MKILLTGAAGFIGSNLAQTLLDQGHEVFGIDNFITGSKENSSKLLKNPKFSFLEADIVNLTNEQKSSFPKFDQVYHLACPTGVPNLVFLAEEMLLTCSDGTKNILDIALKDKASFLFTSSSEVYGDPEKFPQSEDYTGNVDSIGLRSPYEEGKRFSEALTIMYSRKYKLPTKIVRIFNTYGPGMSEKDTRVIPAFIKQILEGKNLTIHGDGSQRRTFCYIDDLVNGLIIVMEKGESEPYNLGGEEEVTINQLAQQISNVSEKKLLVKTKQRASHDHQARMPDLKRIKKLGWVAKTNLKSGLSKTISLQSLQKSFQ